jgi:serine/threonine protein kinase
MSERPPHAPLSHVRSAPVAAETLPPGEVFDTGSPNDSGVSGSKLALLARAAGTPTTAESLVGQTFGDYELLAELGRGGMGVVYRARQKSLDRPVALKMLLRDHLADPLRLARFRSEARAVAALNHPNIVQLYQVGECPFGHFFTMELLEGATLEALARKGKIAVPWATACVAIVAEAIHFAHGRGVIHRDLKPANLLVEKSGRPVVMDFGLAKFRDKSAGLTLQGALMGTPAYMAPEQAGEDPQLEVGPYSDVYALGAILYTLLTNRPPYDGGTPLRTVLQVIDPQLPPPVRQFRPAVPPALERVCVTCLAKKPADRYPTAAALAGELRRLLDAPAGDPPAVTLVVAKTDKELPLTKACTLVGRSSECDVVLKSGDVSKRHCRVLRQPDGVFVEDLDSVNGISVNGQPVRRARLSDGDRLEIARHVFQVRLGQTSSALGGEQR